MSESALNPHASLLVENLCLNIGNQKVTRDLSFNIPVGKNVALLGLNGAGKSSLIRLLVGEYQPLQGLIEFQGLVPTELAYKNKLGYQASNMQPLPELSVKEYLDLCCLLKNALLTNSLKFKKEVITQWHLGSITSSLMSKLSQGNLQKLSVAQAFLGTPEIIILDEPTVALDPVEQQRFIKNLTGLKNSSICIFSSHQINEAVAAADIVLMLDQGKLVAQLNLEKRDVFWLVSRLSATEVKEQSSNKKLVVEGIFQQKKHLLKVSGINEADWQQVLVLLTQIDNELVSLGSSTQALLPLFELLAHGEL